MNWKCPVCGKEFEHFGIKEFAMYPKTTLFGNFKIRDVDGNIKIINRKTNKPVCSEECKQKNEEQYFVEEYKGKLVTKATYAKMARGEMVRYMAENRVEDINMLKSFNRMNYQFKEELSDDSNLVFERKK